GIGSVRRIFPQMGDQENQETVEAHDAAHVRGPQPGHRAGVPREIQDSGASDAASARAQSPRAGVFRHGTALDRARFFRQVAQRPVASQHMKLKTSRNAAETAGAALPRMAVKYFKAGREAANGNPSPKELHRFRIATKRFRYSLELFRPIYGPSLERQLDALRKIQNVLGKLSDYHTMQSLFANHKPLDAQLHRP